MDSSSVFMYVSSWAPLKENGVSGLDVYLFDCGNGALSHVSRVLEGTNCNMSFADEDRHMLYVLDEAKKLPALRAGGGGRVLAFRLNPETGIPSEAGATATFCPQPSFAALDATGEYMVVANHSSTSVVCKAVKDAFGEVRLEVLCDDSLIDLFSMNTDGTIKKLVDVAYHYGSGPKHFHPRPHSAVRSPSGKLFAVCDKGNDKIYFYQIDRENQMLKLSAAPYQDTPGSSPRYCVFHPSLPYLFVNHEGNTVIESFRYDEDGTLTFISAVEICPTGAGAAWDKAEQQGLTISSDGTYIYDLIHGPDVVAVLQVDEAEGTLSVKQLQPASGKWLRGCALSPDGAFLVTACVTDGVIEVFRVAPDGTLNPTGFRAEQPAAAYITFYSAGRL